MRSLRECQARLRAAIVAPRRHADAGLEIYRHAYGARLAETLRKNYPVLAQRLGHESFTRLARRYADAQPSHHFNIRWYGGQLWRELRGAYADLARMEWALGLAFDATDAAPLTWDHMKAISVDEWPSVPLALHPSTQILAMSWAAEDIWQGTSDTHRRHEHALLVWRKELQAHWRIATRPEAAALRALRPGTLADACRALPDADAAQVGTWMAGWIREGMLVPVAAS